MGPLTIALYTLLGLFGAGDLLAHFTHYRYGKTVSASVWWLEHRYPAAYVLIGGLWLLLGTHLLLHLP